MVGPFCGDTDERRRFAGFLGDGDGRFFGGEGRAAGAGAVSVVGLLPPHMAHCKKPASAPSWWYVQAGQAHAATSAIAHKCVLERLAMRSQRWVPTESALEINRSTSFHCNAWLQPPRWLLSITVTTFFSCGRTYG